MNTYRMLRTNGNVLLIMSLTMLFGWLIKDIFSRFISVFFLIFIVIKVFANHTIIYLYCVNIYILVKMVNYYNVCYVFSYTSFIIIIQKCMCSQISNRYYNHFNLSFLSSYKYLMIFCIRFCEI